MTPEEEERIRELCEEIEAEKDPSRLSELAVELTELLEKKSKLKTGNKAPSEI